MILKTNYNKFIHETKYESKINVYNIYKSKYELNYMIYNFLGNMFFELTKATINPNELCINQGNSNQQSFIMNNSSSGHNDPCTQNSIPTFYTIPGNDSLIPMQNFTQNTVPCVDPIIPASHPNTQMQPQSVYYAPIPQQKHSQETHTENYQVPQQTQAPQVQPTQTIQVIPVQQQSQPEQKQAIKPVTQQIQPEQPVQVVQPVAQPTQNVQTVPQDQTVQPAQSTQACEPNFKSDPKTDELINGIVQANKNKISGSDQIALKEPEGCETNQKGEFDLSSPEGQIAQLLTNLSPNPKTSQSDSCETKSSNKTGNNKSDSENCCECCEKKSVCTDVMKDVTKKLIIESIANKTLESDTENVKQCCADQSKGKILDTCKSNCTKNSGSDSVKKESIDPCYAKNTENPEKLVQQTQPNQSVQCAQPTQPVQTQPVQTQPVQAQPVQAQPVQQTQPIQENSSTQTTQPANQIQVIPLSYPIQQNPAMQGSPQTQNDCSNLTPREYLLSTQDCHIPNINPKALLEETLKKLESFRYNPEVVQSAQKPQSKIQAMCCKNESDCPCIPVINVYPMILSK